MVINAPQVNAGLISQTSLGRPRGCRVPFAHIASVLLPAATAEGPRAHEGLAEGLSWFDGGGDKAELPVS